MDVCQEVAFDRVAKWIAIFVVALVGLPAIFAEEYLSQNCNLWATWQVTHVAKYFLVWFSMALPALAVTAYGLRSIKKNISSGD